jgi:hypothetical protein
MWPGNADSTTHKKSRSVCSWPGSTIGARYGVPLSSSSFQLGVYFVADRRDESVKQHVKDNNFRRIDIYDNTLYVSKGSGSNGDDGLFQVGMSGTLPTARPAPTLSVPFSAILSRRRVLALRSFRILVCGW